MYNNHLAVDNYQRRDIFSNLLLNKQLQSNTFKICIRKNINACNHHNIKLLNTQTGLNKTQIYILGITF